jgi:hypothetical protein
MKRFHTRTGKSSVHEKYVYVPTRVGEGAILSGTLKIRDFFKKWHDRYFVLQPSTLNYFRKKANSEQWVGSVLLKAGES